MPAPAGEYSNTSQTFCTTCPTGQYSAAEWGFCEDCPLGQADLDSDPATLCVECGPGEYAEPGTTLCPQCTFDTIDADFDPTTPCEPCPNGFLAPNHGSTQCFEAVCAPTQVGNSSHAAANSVNGTVGDIVPVVCFPGCESYTGIRPRNHIRPRIYAAPPDVLCTAVCNSSMFRCAHAFPQRMASSVRWPVRCI
eukprot:SAG11_NODE_1898_length_4091_cov_9.766283_2_plen_194_part_00